MAESLHLELVDKEPDVHGYTKERIAGLRASGIEPGAPTVTPKAPEFAARAMGQWNQLTGQLAAHDGKTPPFPREADMVGPTGGMGAMGARTTSAAPASPKASTPARAATKPKLLLGQVAGPDGTGSPMAGTRSPVSKPGDAGEDQIPPGDGDGASWTGQYLISGGSISQTVETCIVILTFIALGGVLFYVQTILVPLILAVFAASMLVPLMDALTDRPLRLFSHTWCTWWCGPLLGFETKHDNWLINVLTSVFTVRLPNVIALLVVVFGMGTCMFTCGFVVYKSIDGFVGNIPGYEHRIVEIGNDIIDFVSFDHDNFHVAVFPVSKATDSAEVCTPVMETGHGVQKESCPRDMIAGTVKTQGGDLELGHGNTTVAIRFPGVHLKANHKVVLAYVLFDVDTIKHGSKGSKGLLNVTITGETGHRYTAHQLGLTVMVVHT